MIDSTKYKICIFYHIKEREYDSCLMIADEIQKRNSRVEIVIEEFYKGIYYAFLLRPDVILTIPPRDSNASNRLTILKKSIGCSIISLLTEGYYQDFSESSTQLTVGTNQYSPYLIDQYLFWGEHTRKWYVDVLVKNGKIVDIERSKTVGYVYYDIDKIKNFFSKWELPVEIKEWKNYDKRIIVLTGFHEAEWTESDMIAMSDFEFYGIKGKEKEYERELKKWKVIKRKFLKYRENYLNCVIQLAKEEPDIGILIKLHPVELRDFIAKKRYMYYANLEKYDNIFLLKESVLLSRILSFADILVHYGSTSGLEAYIYDIPTVQLFDPQYPQKKREPGFCIFDSTVKINVNDPNHFRETLTNGLSVRRLNSVEKILEEQFNWTRDRRLEYTPTKTYAKIILDAIGGGQKIKDDIFFRSALNSLQGYEIKCFLVAGIIKVLIRGNFKEAKKYQKVIKDLNLSLIEIIKTALRLTKNIVRKRVLKTNEVLSGKIGEL